MHRVVGPLIVSAAYYLGAQIGFALQAPNAPQSVLWLPNSILLGTLLVVPIGSWPAYLLAAFPAQMLVGWGSGAPPLTMALLFVTNCADAALGAFLARRMAGDRLPFRFDGLRATVVFAVFGAALPTLLLSFADAGLSVATGWTASFDAAFITRARSNVLTHLIVVPALVDLVSIDWRTVAKHRIGEAVGLTVLVILTCALAFGSATGSEAFPALLYTPLPLLLWAAVRFGPGGTAWSVLLVAFVVSWDVLHGRGLFTHRTPLEDVVSLQLFLLASVTPLLFLAAVIRERDTASEALRANDAALRRSYSRTRDLAGKLITAQETERARIARDMHDDFNQQLAALSIQLSALRHGSPGAGEMAAVLGELQRRTVALTDQIRSFSQDLHPAVLDHVGLAAALRTHCTQFARQHRLHLDFAAPDDLQPVPRDVALCVYRIVQEGLRNVVTHAGVGDVSVSLGRSGDRLELAIVDRGRGFEPSAALARGGVGLLSIDERVRLVEGSLTITSAPGQGTRLEVRIPVGAGSRERVPTPA
jgi:two-component system sensor histidine kinase UhpB